MDENGNIGLDELAEHWVQIIYPKFAQTEEQSELMAKSQKELESAHFCEIVSHEVEKAVDAGYRSSHSGKEILTAVGEWKNSKLDVAIDNISKDTLSGIFSSLKNDDKRRAYFIEDFFFSILSRQDPVIEKRGFELLLNNEHMAVYFSQSDMKKFISDKSLEYENNSGLDVVAQYFYEVFTDNTNPREGLLFPQPEGIMKITI